MSPDTSAEIIVRRIVVALDASRYSRVALETAAQLAAAMHAEVLGLFVEDINLLRLAELPFVREVRFSQIGGRQLEMDELLRGLRARAAVLRQAMHEMSQRHQLHTDFRVTRGPVSAELLSAALDADILVLGRLGHSLARRARLGSSARAIVSQALTPVLLVREDIEDIETVVVIFDGSDASHRALRIGLDLAESGHELRVLVAAETDEVSYALRQACVELVGDRGPRVHYRHFVNLAPEGVLKLVSERAGGILILSTRDSRLSSDVIQRLLDDAPHHILLIR